MSKVYGLLLSAVLLLGGGGIVYADTISVSPTTGGSGSIVFTPTYDSPQDSSTYFYVFAPDGSQFDQRTTAFVASGVSYDAGADNGGTPPFPLGTYHVVISTNDDSDTLCDIYSTCDQVLAETVYIVSDSSPAQNMDTIITNASTTFTTAVGFNWSDVVTFMKSLLLLVIGSGLGLFETLMPYIIALVTISVIVYFVYRAFRFFRH